jgi:hypothetical protein
MSLAAARTPSERVQKLLNLIMIAEESKNSLVFIEPEDRPQ